MERNSQDSVRKIWASLFPGIAEGLIDNQEYVAQGLLAFSTLCNQGCDPQTLASLLALLTLEDPIRTNSSTFRPRPFDSKRNALDLDPRTVKAIGERGRGIYSELTRIISEIDQLNKDAEQFAKDIQTLRTQPLVLKLVRDATIQPGDLLWGSLIPVRPEAFLGIDALARFLKDVGAKRKPDSTRIRKAIHSHIRERTGKWHDNEMADTLNALSPDRDSDNPMTQDHVKQWRYHQDLTDSTLNLTNDSDNTPS